MTMAGLPTRAGSFFALAPLVFCAVSASAQSPNSAPGPPKFRVVALAERTTGDHQKFVDAAKLYLNNLVKGLPQSFEIDREEWYTWNRSPRPNVHVLATVDESSYVPNTRIKMGGDHPVVWSNPHYQARNVYIFMGHHGGLFENPAFVQLFRNAVFWGAGK